MAVCADLVALWGVARTYPAFRGLRHGWGLRSNPRGLRRTDLPRFQGIETQFPASIDQRRLMSRTDLPRFQGIETRKNDRLFRADAVARTYPAFRGLRPDAAPPSACAMPVVARTYPAFRGLRHDTSRSGRTPRTGRRTDLPRFQGIETLQPAGSVGPAPQVARTYPAFRGLRHSAVRRERGARARRTDLPRFQGIETQYQIVLGWGTPGCRTDLPRFQGIETRRNCIDSDLSVGESHGPTPLSGD